MEAEVNTAQHKVLSVEGGFHRNGGLSTHANINVIYST